MYIVRVRLWFTPYGYSVDEGNERSFSTISVFHMVYYSFYGFAEKGLYMVFSFQHFPGSGIY